jgi:hypothetical protein
MFHLVGFGGSGFFAMGRSIEHKERDANKKYVNAGDAELRQLLVHSASMVVA